MAKSNNKDNFQIQFGKRIRALRKDKNLSLRKLSQRCNLDYSDIAKYEKGEVNIQLSTIYELSVGLQVAPKELFDFDFVFNDN
ncbi:helix-turn-helix domain-containing protein [Gelidibacter maritimus]|uniref:Helix-turn-helix transcriptional regulator n=1 Tax=Gelidibacter maritimus TaxID=2761487 RepID=A0A7W2M5H5_9FLAO|nr:helix-turn-helix transcriptional regulator [Gelidibacter maritimus]MBA6153098.1 helix-turn-helix transcriptional regulator [Gelidibacter maritimus]